MTPLAELRRRRKALVRAGRMTEALEAAQEIAERDPGCESYLHLGVITREAGRAREALKILRDALRFKSGPRHLLAEVHVHLAAAWMVLGEPKRVAEALKRARLLRPPSRVEAKWHHVLGNYHFARRKYIEAVREYLLAENGYPDAYSRGSMALNRGMALRAAGRLVEAAVPIERAIRIFTQGGYAAGLALARTERAGLWFQVGQVRRAYSMLLRVAQAWRKVGNPAREAQALQNAGYTAGELELWAQAKELQDRAIEQAVEVGHRDILACAYGCRATAHANLDRPREAREDLARAAKALRGRRFPLGALHIMRAKCKIACHDMDWDAVARLSRSAERLAARIHDTARVLEYRRLRARAEEERGRLRAARFLRTGAVRIEHLLHAAREGLRKRDRVMEKIAATQLAVLLLGTARGVERARELHRLSRRSSGPFVVVRCDQVRFAASEIGGRVRGAWTDAATSDPGYFQRAHGGTLVLERVDSLDRASQKVLLRMADGYVRPVGGGPEERLDVRIVATCDEPERLLPGLRERLSGAVVRLAPLDPEAVRTRVEAVVAGRREVTPDALSVLTGHAWSEGGADLLAVVERLVLRSKKRIGVRGVRQALGLSRRRTRASVRV